ncbi:hypothetical protein JCM10449v2_005613 [Rhodotorula kratochvilovae]
MAAVSPPHSPPAPPPASALSPLQHLADQDHCFPPSQTSPVLPSRARSGSRTYKEVQDDERELARQRTRSRERAAAEDALEGRKSHERPHANEQIDGEMSMNELRAEMETLLSLRRRSMSQPVAVDPDLPPTAPPTSAPPIKRPNLSLAIPTLTEGPGGGPVSPTAPTPAETGTLVRRRSSVGVRLPSEHPLPAAPPLPSPTLQLPPSPHFSPSSGDGAAPAASTPSQNLFWLPASLHPELAPAEFKAFIREQTRPEALARRTSLSAGGGSAPTAGGGAGPGRMNRRASLLRGEYKPRAGDGVGGDAREEAIPPVPSLARTASDGAARGQRRSRNTLSFEELTIKDLQRLEELAAKAEAEGGATAGEEEEGERLGRVLRRSLSLNPHRVAAAAASAGASFGGTLPSTAEEAPSSEPLELNDDEAPIIVPPPGQILRRNARTRIRKASIGAGEGGAGVGFGGGSRFGSSRRAGRTSASSSTLDLEGAGSEGGHEPATPPASVEGPSVESEGEGSSPPSSEQLHVDLAPAAAVGVVEPAPLLPTKEEQAPIPQMVLDRPPADEEPAPLPLAPELAPAPAALEPAAAVSPPEPSPPPRHAISPASAEYDWATHHLPTAQQPAPPPPPAPAAEPQYTVHPQHLPRQPFDAVPPPQAVPLPLPAPPRKESPPSAPPAVPAPPARAESPKPAAAKEKKSGWARLGLGRDEDAKKRKGKGKERERSEDGTAPTTGVEKEKEREKEGSSGFLSGLFGRKRGGAEPDAAPVRAAPSPPPEPRIPPPPPTASGVLLPNGRYANFYRLPIHVERAVYRLSHIKLANPRRPLYEQVLISNLMFWYLGLIQKPVAPPPPAAPPVPIPGVPSPSSSGPPSPHQQHSHVPPPSSPQKEHKRVGLSKPSRAPAGAGRPAAEMPMRTVSYEAQNAQLVEEQQRHAQHGAYGPPPPAYPASPGAPQQAAGGASPRALFAPPLSSTSAPSSPEKQPPPRSPERTSAPAAMYARPPGAGSAEDDDDRPLALAQQQQHTQQQQQRESFPPNRPPQPPRSPGRPQAFEVTSRRVSGGSAPADSALLGSAGTSKHERRASAVSDKSFDAGEIYDAYAPTSAPGSPGQSAAKELPPAPAPALVERPPGAVLGAVAPRGSSLKALSR